MHVRIICDISSRSYPFSLYSPRLDHIPLLVCIQAKIKLKLITSLVSSLSAPAKYLGPLEGKKTLVNRVGLREGVNPDRVLLCAIATTVITKDRIP